MKNNHTKSKLRPVVLAIGASLALGLINLPIANAASASKTFTADQLSSGYKLAHMDKHDKCDMKSDKKMKGKEGKCGPGKCGPTTKGKKMKGKTKK